MPRHRRAWTTSLAVAFVVVGVDRSAFAAPEHGSRFELEWLAPSACPDRDEGAAWVAKFLGRAPGMAADPHVRARVHIAPNPEGFTAEIELTTDGESSRRKLDSRRCEVAADGAAYVIAAVIDPTVEPPAPEPEPAPKAAPQEARTAPPGSMPVVQRPIEATRTPLPSVPHRRARIVRGAFRVGGALGVGALPRVAGGIAASAGVLLPRLRFELGVIHWFARSARLEDRPDTGGDIDLTAATVRVCPLAVARPVEVPVCGGLELGRMRGTGAGIGEPTTVQLMWAALSASVGVIWMPSRWAGLWLDAALHVPVSRPVFEIDGVGRVFQPAPAAFAGTIGLEARFP